MNCQRREQQEKQASCLVLISVVGSDGEGETTEEPDVAQHLKELEACCGHLLISRRLVRELIHTTLSLSHDGTEIFSFAGD